MGYLSLNVEAEGQRRLSGPEFDAYHLCVRRYIWIKDDPVGMEQAEIDFGADGFTARSVAFGSEPVPYRLDLDLRVGHAWVTERLALTATGDGWDRSLVLERTPDGTWRGNRTAAGSGPPAISATEPVDALESVDIPAEVIDVDVQWSPVTNLMPTLRLGTTRTGATGSFTMAWVSVPSLAVTLDEQRYTLLGLNGGDVCVRFDSGDGFFTAVLRCDDDGVVRTYPSISRRLGDPASNVN